MYVGRVVVGVSGSPGSLGALRYAAEMARGQRSALTPVLAWTPPGGEVADRRYPSPYLRAIWKQAAWDRLWHAVDLALGGPPDDVDFSPEVVRGQPGEVLARVARPNDVIVIGSGRPGGFRRLLACTVGRYCLAHARCPVIAVPPAQLAAEAHGLHGWVLRRRMHAEKANLHAADV
jgi:nucleotide-binding universal stress UspA family protein